MQKRASIHVKGIVQGVGFRPFVYRKAKELSLLGYVLNLGDAGVRIVVEGEESHIEMLINEIHTDPPSISRIDTFTLDWQETQGDFQEFLITKSSTKRSENSEPVIPPDIAMCDDCLPDLMNPNSCWYLYPFTSCAACGPRFSTITDLPYDRPNTTMADFPLCDTCNTGYTNPLDRRYHAQTTACENCGPIYRLYDAHRNELISSDTVQEISKLLEKGSVVAMQGIAGTHLVTITSDPRPIRKLRKRKKRSQRPFAIMVRSLEVAKELFDITPAELAMMNTWRRPIVLVKKKKLDCTNLSVLGVIPKESLEEIAPGLDSLGVMLPYAPIHHMLFQCLDEASLVMTSANPSGVPMYITSEKILSSLNDIADHFLLHNRRIHQRADDSVVKFTTDDNPVFIRRARGYVPEPIPTNGVSKSVRLLAVGPEEKSTVSILKSGMIYPSQHIGDTNNIESIEFLENAYRHLMRLVGLNDIDGIASDLHPEFLSTLHAETISQEKQIPLFRIQHHHAHLASMLVDHKVPLDTSIVCITTDGFGYGQDKTAWGGEVLAGNAKEYLNLGGLESYLLPGGDLTAVYAARSLVGMLHNDTDEKTILRITEGMPVSHNEVISSSTLNMIRGAIDQEVNVVRSSSAGRFLDASAALLGICNENTYDGECPMKLEAVAKKGTLSLATKIFSDGKKQILDTSGMLHDLANLHKAGARRSELAYAAQWYLGDALAHIAISIAEERDVKRIGFSGGVALNTIISKAIVERVEVNGMKPLLHRTVPPGDGGISIGQIAVGTASITDI
ncbi:MAG: carbamoyltransferase HypF [Candidatus Thorarchaeota archaeon]|nr:carbamoyltransferase HypF [Candidatus Thorarchaeota archaeon]